MLILIKLLDAPGVGKLVAKFWKYLVCPQRKEKQSKRYNVLKHIIGLNETQSKRPHILECIFGLNEKCGKH